MSNILPTIEILVQPASNYRMRYEAEKRETNFITGQIDDRFFGNTKPTSMLHQLITPLTPATTNIRPHQIVYPKIRIFDPLRRPGRLLILCVNSIASLEGKYSIHPNILIGDNCENGFAVLNYQFSPDSLAEHVDVTLNRLCIQHVKKKEVEESIRNFKLHNIDPFQFGFDFDRYCIDLNRLRLCFQVIVQTKYSLLNYSQPIVSNIIYNGAQGLIIEHVINSKGCVLGGSHLILLLKKLSSDQRCIYARFYENDTDWNVIVKADHNHYGCTLVYKVPPYKDRLINQSVEVSFQLILTYEKFNDVDTVVNERVFSQSYKFTYEPAFQELLLIKTQQSFIDSFNFNDSTHNDADVDDDVDYDDDNSSQKRHQFDDTDGSVKRIRGIWPIDKAEMALKADSNNNSKKITDLHRFCNYQNTKFS